MVEPQGAVVAEERDGARRAEPPMVAEEVELDGAPVERVVVAAPRDAVMVKVEQPTWEDSQVEAAGVGAPRSGERVLANARHNIRRIYCPMEMTYDSSGT